MIKDRFFMTGLGVGLVIGALLLALMGKAEGLASNDIPTTSLSKEQIVEQAEAAGLKVVESSEELLTEAEWTQSMVEKSGKLQGDSTEEPKQTDPAEPVNPEEPETPDKTSSENSKTTKPTVKTPTAPSKSATATPAATAEPKSSKVIPFRIKEGSNLTEIANDLKKAGIITNSEQFIKEATSQKVNTKLRKGTYTFSDEETHKSIITKITMKPSR